MINQRQARDIVYEEINKPDPYWHDKPEMIILDEHTVEKEYGWVFYWTSRPWHSMSVNILDTRTGMKMWEKKEFYPLTFEELLPWLRSTKDGDDQVNFFRIEFSPDSRFVMFSRSDRFRFRHEVDLLTVAASKDTALALDLTTLKPVEIGGDMKQISARPGDPKATFVINGSAAFVRFNLQGNKLFILSDAQSVYAFDLSKIAAKTTTQAK